MPRSALHMLRWSAQSKIYILLTPDQPPLKLETGKEEPWLTWLASHSSFSFQGQYGHLNVLKEVRKRGAGYWYAYHTTEGRNRKRYLGSTDKISLARLEETAKALSQEAERQAQESASSPHSFSALLSTRLSPPRLPSFLVERSRLLAELEAVYTYPLTLVSASAGSGKTTLLSAWASRQKNPVAWLSLDASDTNPVRFWASCIAALRCYDPTAGGEALALLHAREALPLSTILVSLLNDIALLHQEIILILDDFHLIEDQAIYEGLSFLLDHLPARAHLVLSTRTDPRLPLSRLRVKGQLIEIRSSDLCFSHEEAAHFLRDGMALPLSANDIAILLERTEGWIAGLHLAALSLRKQQDLSAFVKDFGGSHRYLLDYVQQDIITHLPQRVQDFLLQTSVVTSMNAALVQAVTSLPTLQASQQLLEELERANLLVIPLDSRREWYRYHDLFREALQARLHASQPELVSLLHMRAARWYEAQGELREAITHAQAAQDFSFAASLMERAAPALWLHGEVETVYTWMLSLPDPVLRVYLRLALNAAFHLVNSITIATQLVHSNMQAQVERIHRRMEAILRRKSELVLSDAEVALIGRRLRVLRALATVMTIIKDGNQEGLRLLTLEMEALPPDEEAHWNVIPLYFIFWWEALLLGKGASLIERLLTAKQQMMEAGDSLVTIRVRCWLAFAYTQAAQLQLAQQECLEILALVEQNGARTILVGYVYHFLFQVAYARNRLEEAADWLSCLRQIAQEWQLIDLLVREKILSVRLALAREDFSTAQEFLEQLTALVEQEGLATHRASLIALRVQWWVAEGKLAQASQWAAQTTLSSEAWNPLRKEEALALIHVSIAQRHYAQAVETLDSFSHYLDRPGDPPSALSFLALSVVALFHAGQSTRAQNVATRLLTLTEPEGMLRVYLDAGPLMKQALTMLLEVPHHDESCTVASFRPYVLRILAASEQEGHESAHAQAAHLSNHRHPQALLSPLSRQEQQVLRLLMVGQTYAEMAQTLVVSLNTIKSQVSSIYRKLGVSRRTEAMAVTTRLNLL
ncbi:LuxR C-terminal-related transcriptional regulator [Ktedonobacter racemifer]|nr:LuxR C-terminal-related transcriptional regulator [Ktedonobacter racemifer]